MIKNRDKSALLAFGKHLRNMRKERGLSQEQLENLADISKNQIGNIERGEVNVTLISLLAISKALDISPKDLFDN